MHNLKSKLIKSVLKKPFYANMASQRPSSNLADFRKVLSKCNNVAILTGAGISAESGIPTFRGAGGYWRKWQAQQLASPEAFEANPSLVWEFYHHRREVVFTKQPNAAHYAVAKFQENMNIQNRNVTVITQNIDELHKFAGAKNIIELHGSMFKVRCTKCSIVEENRDSPICPALSGKGEPHLSANDAQIPVDKLPACKHCGHLLRPHVVWFGESLNPHVLQSAENVISNSDMVLIVGTSSVVYPAAAFAPDARERGIPVAEFNIEDTVKTDIFNFHFQGKSGDWLPKALKWPLDD